jgi:hypothetical protein
LNDINELFQKKLEYDQKINDLFIKLLIEKIIEIEVKPTVEKNEISTRKLNNIEKSTKLFKNIIKTLMKEGKNYKNKI